ncbi:hypothetical protein F0562_020743 [Nyssa sinensis]|uniref:Uncharacterized protein n=1 Tax=Nyssa sinensis TaxID=561372 RepID=A0A5J5BT03_9ASTE|nr:hypothetical protein F0562_020743 [Nyssa sinensis]
MSQKSEMEGEVDERDLKAAGAELLPDGRHGLRIHGWEIESRKRPILNSLDVQQITSMPVTILLPMILQMVANYHSEMPHILDYSRYPDLEERQRFVRVYLSSSGITGSKPLRCIKILWP